jgi:hypothetical protein
MLKLRRTIIIIAVILLTTGVLQLIRLNLIVQWTKSTNVFAQVDLSSIYRLPDDMKKNITQEKFLIVFDSEEQENLLIMENVSCVLEYMKKEYTCVDVAKLTEFDNNYKTIIITFSDWEKIKTMDSLIGYAEQGGKVFFARVPLINDGFFGIYRKLGIYEYFNFKPSNNISIVSDILIKGKNKYFEIASIKNTLLLLRVEKYCKIHIDNNDGLPILWENILRKGKIAVFNGTMLADKLNRGVISGIICSLNNDLVYPVINAKAIFIDNFPAPLKGGDNFFKEHYSRNAVQFYRDIWWPDVLSSAVVNNVKYTGLFIKSYNDIVKAPFPKTDGIDIANLISFGRDILKNRGEIGFQGYNHQPLTLDKTISESYGYKVHTGTR